MKRGINFKMLNTLLRINFAVLCSRIGTQLTSKPPPPPPPPPHPHTHTLGFSGIVGGYRLRRMCFIKYGHRAISCPVSFLYELFVTGRGTAIRIPRGYSTKIVQLSCSLHSLGMEIVRNSYVRSDAGGDCTVTVRSSSSLCVRVPKVYKCSNVCLCCRLRCHLK